MRARKQINFLYLLRYFDAIKILFSEPVHSIGFLLDFIEIDRKFQFLNTFSIYLYIRFFCILFYSLQASIRRIRVIIYARILWLLLFRSTINFRKRVPLCVQRVIYSMFPPTIYRKPEDHFWRAALEDGQKPTHLYFCDCNVIIFYAKWTSKWFLLVASSFIWCWAFSH